MDPLTQYQRYIKAVYIASRGRSRPQGFAHFIVDVFPYTLFN